MLRRVLSMAASPGNSSEADLLSYLFFDRSYTSEIETRGFEDAMRREEMLAAFFESQRVTPDPTHQE